jgi:hypothetical protein
MGREIKGAMEREGKADSSPGAVDTPTHCLQQKEKKKASKTESRMQKAASGRQNGKQKTVENKEQKAEN